jgi:hypothetical protein
MATIKKLAEQADRFAEHLRYSLNGQNWKQIRDERFAELIRQDEREAIARMLETKVELKGLDTEPLILQFALDMITSFAKFIRERGEK